MLFVLASGTNAGRAGGLRAALGIGAGSCIHTVAAAAGLSAVLASSSVVFAAVKLTGAAYLVVLGLGSLLRRERGAGPAEPSALSAAGMVNVESPNVFWRAALTNVLNPKVALFFLALVPHFVSAERGHMALQFVLLGVVFNITGTLINAAVGVFAGQIGRRLAGSAAWKRVLDRVTGAIFVGLGIRLALVGQR
jgi:threonine/homoserine/homoserine lactone efflux protein